MDKALELAIKAAGGQLALADALGITQPAIAQWSQTPVMRVLEVERITGISRYLLRPDVYGKPPRKRASRSGKAA